jgi:hypothetical protein
VISLAISFAACSNPTTTSVSTPYKPPPGAITKDTIGGYQPIKGVLQADTTYYMDSTVVIAAGDTLLIDSGAHIVMLNTGTNSAVGSPEFQVFGTLIANGTPNHQIYMSPPVSKKKYADLTNVSSNELWGGIECAGPTTAGVTNGGSGDVILKWTHIEFAGGSSGTTDPIVGSGGTRYAVWFQNPKANFIMENSWVTGSTDDPLRVSSGQISIIGNVVECAAPTSGDFNFKSGTVGDCAYNVFVGVATNGPKSANTGGVNPECNVNIYNNTIVTGGWRCTKSGRAGSSDIEGGARGIEYNNLIVNCRTGMRILGDPTLADTANIAYDYQYYYGSTDSVVSHFYPSDGIQVVKPHDVHGTAGANNPMFVGYDVNQFTASTYNKFPMAFSDQLSIPAFNLMRAVDEKGNQRFTDVSSSFKSDFHLASGSPCIGTAYTGTVKTNSGTTIAVPQYQTLSGASVKSGANPYGADYTAWGLGKDFGAYQTNGTGMQQ